MRIHTRRMTMVAGLALGGGFLLAGPGTGCMSFAAESALTTTDFCFIFDCGNGLLGGTIDPCPGGETGDDSGQAPLFVDCPELRGP